MVDTTDVIVDDEMIDPATGEIINQKELAEQLLAQAKEQGGELGRAWWLAEPAYEERPRDSVERRVDRTPRS